VPDLYPDNHPLSDAGPFGLLRKVNARIGGQPVLTPEEREGLFILARAQTYLLNRADRGEEIFTRELLERGRSTHQFDPAAGGPTPWD
jgi:hypothetical protein